MDNNAEDNGRFGVLLAPDPNAPFGSFEDDDGVCWARALSLCNAHVCNTMPMFATQCPCLQHNAACRATVLLWCRAQGGSINAAVELPAGGAQCLLWRRACIRFMQSVGGTGVSSHALKELSCFGRNGMLTVGRLDFDSERVDDAVDQYNRVRIGLDVKAVLRGGVHPTGCERRSAML